VERVVDGLRDEVVQRIDELMPFECVHVVHSELDVHLNVLDIMGEVYDQI